MGSLGVHLECRSGRACVNLLLFFADGDWRVRQSWCPVVFCLGWQMGLGNGVERSMIMIATDVKLLVRVVVVVVARASIQAAALFVPAGTWNWPAAWVLIAITIFGTLLSATLLWFGDKRLLGERMSGPVHQGQPLIDKILLGALLATFVGVQVLSSIDVWHLKVAPSVHEGVSWLGLMMVLAGSALWIATLLTNKFGSVAVKHQAADAHEVIDSGPYAIVRHPMYLAILLVLIGQPLWLGSFAGFMLGLAGVVILGVRAVLEERFLCVNLRGYDDYSARVRYRLIPLVW